MGPRRGREKGQSGLRGDIWYIKEGLMLADMGGKMNVPPFLCKDWEVNRERDKRGSNQFSCPHQEDARFRNGNGEIRVLLFRSY